MRFDRYYGERIKRATEAERKISFVSRDGSGVEMEKESVASRRHQIKDAKRTQSVSAMSDRRRESNQFGESRCSAPIASIYGTREALVSRVQRIFYSQPQISNNWALLIR